MIDNPKCTICGNENLVEIQYGFPTPTMVERARKELIALGGFNNGGYTHYCYTCHETHPPTEWPE